MSRHVAGSPKRSGFTLYGIFIILALFPAAFAVAFQVAARGIESGRPWLVAVCPLVLLVATNAIPHVWRRSSVFALVVGAVAAAAAGLFCRDMADMFAAGGVSTSARYLAPLGITAVYALFGLVMGWRHVVESGAGRRTSRVVAPSRERVSR